MKVTSKNARLKDRFLKEAGKMKKYFPEMDLPTTVTLELQKGKVKLGTRWGFRLWDLPGGKKGIETATTQGNPGRPDFKIRFATNPGDAGNADIIPAIDLGHESAHPGMTLKRISADEQHRRIDAAVKIVYKKK